MPFTREELQRIQKHVAKYRIEFVGELLEADWPQYHRRLFEDIQHISNERFATYAANPNATSYWKTQTKREAQLLMRQAKNCQSHGEDTWRLACEPIIFRRYSADVVCRSCRHQTWILETEALNDWANRHNIQAWDPSEIRKQRRKRPKCTCPKFDRDCDLNEANGMSELFSFCANTQVLIDEDIVKTLGNRGSRPDGIFGLQPSLKFKNALYDKFVDINEEAADIVEKAVYNVVEPCPVDIAVENLLFPFMVIEAKSGKAKDEWHSINMQTAFPIRECLLTQQRLWAIQDAGIEAYTRPIVWYLANKGRDWCVSIAFLQANSSANTAEKLEFKIAEVWHGSIETANGALQLLLIIDNIFDWAREKYREDIYKKLRRISSGDNDITTDHYSVTEPTTATHGVEYTAELQPNTSKEQQPEHLPAELAFIEREASNGVVRHAAFIKTIYHSITITSNNAEICILNLIKLGLKELVLTLLIQMPTAMRVASQTILELEQYWTAHVRDDPIDVGDDTEFFTMISCTHGITGHWTLIRELYVFSVATDAWEIVVGRVQGINIIRKPAAFLLIAKDAVFNAVKQLQDSNIGGTLLSCVSRSCVELNSSSHAKQAKAKSAKMVSTVYPLASSGAFRDVAFRLTSLLIQSQLILHKSFHKTSQRLDDQLSSIDENNIPPFRNKLSREAPNGQTLDLPEAAHILVYRKANKSARGKACERVCMYIANSDAQVPSQDQISQLFKTTFEKQFMYYTRGFADQLRISAFSGRDIWNLPRVRAYCTDIDILQYLSAELCRSCPPTRQAAPRLIEGVQSALYLRQVIASIISEERQTRETFASEEQLSVDAMFLIYKSVSCELIYWKEQRRLSRKKKRRWSCAWCNEMESKSTGQSQLCETCDEITVDVYWPSWFRNFVADVATWLEDQRYQDDWYKALAGYNRLDDPFQNIPQLLEQYAQFKLWHGQTKTMSPSGGIQSDVEKRICKALNARTTLDTDPSSFHFDSNPFPTAPFTMEDLVTSNSVTKKRSTIVEGIESHSEDENVQCTQQ